MTNVAAMSGAAVSVIPTKPTLAQQFHLLGRFGFGAHPHWLGIVAARGVNWWWNDQVARGRQTPGYSADSRIAAQGPLLSKTPAQVRAWQKANGNEYGWYLMDQLTRVTLGLQAFSNNQLYESVVDFFGNHLNVANHADDQTWVRHTMDRDVIRKHAFGRFSDMLVASARNPAMLRYLNLAESSKTLVNENYGRELLELHTVGIGARYTEAEVKATARLLTGRTLNWDTNVYTYRPDLHWTGLVSILGFRHGNHVAADGEAVGDGFLRHLARHPSTAQNLARKLCIRYVSDNPPAALVSRIAAVYLANDTAILPTLRAILDSREFWASAGQKIRRPTENLLATLRILPARTGANVADTLSTLHWMTAAMGNTPLDWAPPNGYPDVAAAWRSSSNLLTLWQYHRGLLQNWWKNALIAPPVTSYYGTTKPKTSAAAIKLLWTRLIGIPITVQQQNDLQAFLGEPSTTPVDSSNIRWYLDHLVPLMLDGPQHARR